MLLEFSAYKKQKEKIFTYLTLINFALEDLISLNSSLLLELLEEFSLLGMKAFLREN